MAHMTAEGSDIQGSTYAGDTGTSEASGMSDIAAQGKEQFKRYGGMARDVVFHRADSKKKELVKHLNDFASTLESACQESEGVVRQAMDATVGYVRRASDRIGQGSSEELLQEAGEKVRERPGVFFAGCLAIGFLAARILKA
jgi:hypothetical protein